MDTIRNFIKSISNFWEEKTKGFSTAKKTLIITSVIIVLCVVISAMANTGGENRSRDNLHRQVEQTLDSIIENISSSKPYLIDGCKTGTLPNGGLYQIGQFIINECSMANALNTGNNKLNCECYPESIQKNIGSRQLRLAICLINTMNMFGGISQQESFGLVGVLSMAGMIDCEEWTDDGRIKQKEK